MPDLVCLDGAGRITAADKSFQPARTPRVPGLVGRRAVHRVDPRGGRRLYCPGFPPEAAPTTVPTDFSQRARRYLADASSTLQRLPLEVVDRIFAILRGAYLEDHQVILMGNGGSAALASHAAVDLGKGTVAPGRRRFRVVSIVDNTPVMTAYANDLSYADVFSEQIRTLARPGDVVFGVSGSGNSPNVLNGLAAARGAGAVTVVMTGYEGGKAAGLADVALVVPSDDMQQIENCHLALAHLFMQAMCEVVRESAPLDPEGTPAGSPAAPRTTVR